MAPPANELIFRPRLRARLLDSHARIVRLIAPAGYGKSSLVASVADALRHYVPIDLEGAATELDIARRFVRATAAFQPAGVCDDLPQLMVGLGTDIAGWTELAAGYVQGLPPESVLHFENAEALSGLPMLESLTERLAASPNTASRIIVCSRVDVLRFRDVGPQRVLRAPDLRLSRAEVARALRSLDVSEEDFDAIERFALGWPIVVMMLRSLARYGRLREYLTEQHDSADLYTYLATEVFATLPEALQRLLEAITSLPDISEAELSLLFPNENIPQSLRKLRDDTPFVAYNRGRFEVHPALRQMLTNTVDIDRYRERLFALVDRSDGGLRAARIALLRDREIDAARVLSECRGQGNFWTPSLAEVFDGLPDSVFTAFPDLWIGAVYMRASYDVVGTLLTTQRLLSEISEACEPQTRIDIITMLAQLLANRGLLDDARDTIDGLIKHPSLAGDPTASSLHAFFGGIIEFYRGDPIDRWAFAERFADLFASSPTQHSFCQGIIFAPYHRARGERELEDAAIDRSIQIALATKEPLVITIAYTYAAMGAWFWGDDDRFEQYVAGMQASLLPSFENMFSHFLSCVAGHGLTAKTLSEKLDMRTYAYAIGATRARTFTERRQLADAALLAAQQSSQRLCEVIALVVLASCDPDRRLVHLERAERLAAEMEAPALQNAVREMRAGSKITMLKALVAGAPSEEIEAEQAPLVFDAGLAYRNGVEIKLSPRERALLTYLAVQGAPVDVHIVVATIWPDAAVERALGTLRVTVARLRRRVGDARVVLATSTGYRTGIPITFKGS
jgi:hypothetical protein